ncbi:MAG TPA: hypothetical protein VFG68_23485 [Fimbriiglobus sp.]|nr:hypothetical protein [Fimbriiglobus sp.]
MSTTPPSTTTGYQLPPGARGARDEIKLISHSNLFYWWPVWALAFFMALWTYIEDHRLAIIPDGGRVSFDERLNQYTMQFPEKKTTKSLETAVRNADLKVPAFKPRISQDAWLGAVFTVGLLLTIAITNIPLRGLWSFITLIMIVVVALFISLFPGGWDAIFEKLAGLHIHINMAGYLFIGVCVFLLWALATFVFDRRSYVIFTPGQIKVCEHIGAAVKTYDTYGIHMEKQRDDLFRHYILGFGSGDLIIVTSGAEKHEIKLPNVLGIGWRLRSVEDMLRERTTVIG